jgi:hypothetical protein
MDDAKPSPMRRGQVFVREVPLDPRERLELIARDWGVELVWHPGLYGRDGEQPVSVLVPRERLPLLLELLRASAACDESSPATAGIGGRV